MASPRSTHPLLTPVLLLVTSLAVFLVYIQFPVTLNFDEFHYIPAARQILQGLESQNWEHPPLGKQLIAIGMAIFGDRPIGWRFMSALFGSLTLVAMYFWARAVLRSRRWALVAALITLFNQLLYVQSRIAMLDTFMFAFLSAALACFSWAWTAGVPAAVVRRRLRFAGACFGAAMACKWSALIPWMVCVGLSGGALLLRSWGTEFTRPSLWKKEPEFEEWFTEDLWKGVTPRSVAWALIAVPALVYFADFLPFLFVEHVPSYTLWDLVLMQVRMYEGQLRVVGSHPYSSTWPGWALLQRPIWYAFDRQPGDQVRGVLLLGNPLVMWGGLAAWVGCLWAALTRRARDAFLITALYGALYFGWALIPRKVSFYYYYYPAGMTLSLALAWALQHFDRSRRQWVSWTFVAACAAIFLYFLPILGAWRIGAGSFVRWMWSSSWI